MFFFFFQAEDGIRDVAVTGVQTCALPISEFGQDDQVRAVGGGLLDEFERPPHVPLLLADDGLHLHASDLHHGLVTRPWLAHAPPPRAPQQHREHRAQRPPRARAAALYSAGPMVSSARYFVLLLVLLMASPLVLGEYAQQILSQAFFFAIAAVTVDLLWGYTGILTFGQSAFFGVGVYTVALALAYYVEGALGMAAVMLGAMVAAALIGAAVGWLSFFDLASPIYVAIVTLALPVEIGRAHV